MAGNVSVADEEEEVVRGGEVAKAAISESGSFTANGVSDGHRCKGSVEPFPPNRSFPQPNTTEPDTSDRKGKRKEHTNSECRTGDSLINHTFLTCNQLVPCSHTNSH